MAVTGDLSWKNTRVESDTVMAISDYQTAQHIYGQPVADLMFPRSWYRRLWHRVDRYIPRVSVHWGPI